MRVMAMQITLVDGTDVIGIGGHDAANNYVLNLFRISISAKGTAKMTPLTPDEALAWYEQGHPAA